MFGYIKPDRPELKLRELGIYEGYYCALCKTIGNRYGALPRLTLSYDCTFIALLLSGVSGCAGMHKARCFYKPFKKEFIVANESDALNFAADLSVILAHYKSADDWRDEKKLSHAAFAKLISGAFQKAALNAPEAARAVDEGIKRLNAVESERSSALDAAAHEFAEMMRAVVDSASFIPEGNNRTALSSLAYNIGKWLYLADAWDDRQKDEKTGSYNPYLISGCNVQRASFLMNYSLNTAISAFELIEFKSHADVIDNIITLGCVKRTEQLLGGTNDKSV